MKFFKINNQKIRVGYFCEIKPYSIVMASTRLRVYDIINAFGKDERYSLEIYNPLKKYDILIFQKRFDKRAYALAKKKKPEAKIVLDINVDYLNEEEKYIKSQQRNDMKKFLKLCDGVITSSDHLRKIYQKEVDFEVKTIEENIPKKLLDKEADIDFEEIRFLWSGYAVKAKDLLLIKEILVNLYSKKKFSINIISEKDPKLKIGKIPINYYKFKEKNIENILLKGNIFLAPRDLSKPYNLGHTFTKIGVAMALGIPVIADPVPAYTKSPALLCKNKEDWEKILDDVINKKIDLREISSKGRVYCKKNYSMEKIKKQYENYFRGLIK